MRALAPLVLSLFVSSGCTSPTAKFAEGPSCEERQAQLVSVLSQLPDTLLNTKVGVALANATLAGGFGNGIVVELDEARTSVDGQPITAATEAERVEQVVQAVSRAVPASTSTSGVPVLYIAAAGNLDMRTLHAYLSAMPSSLELRLVFARPTLTTPTAPELHESPYASRLLTERDPAQRRAVASAGYDVYSDCEAIDIAVSSVAAEPEATRWSTLRQRMLDAVPRCACDDIDPDGLRQLLVAEQRAGAVALGSVTANYLRDVRCRASMPLRSVQQVLGDVEDFDAEFSGRWTETELTFDDVITDERLLNALCMAMPGDVLESVQREYETIYVRPSGAEQCQGYRFEPIARGAPFGTLRHASPSGNVAYHYRQGGNEIRIFGPVPDDNSRPTDAGPWHCDVNLKMSAVDASSVHIEGGGRFYLNEAACGASPDPAALLPGCVLDPTAKAPSPPSADADASTTPSAAPDGTEAPSAP